MSAGNPLPLPGRRRRPRLVVPDADQVASVQEGADFLGISETSMRKLLGRVIPYHRPFGRKIGIKLIDLRAYRDSLREVGARG